MTTTPPDDFPTKGSEIERRQHVDRFPARNLSGDSMQCADAIQEAIRQLERQVRFHNLIGADPQRLEQCLETLWAIYQQHGLDDEGFYDQDSKPWGFLTDLMDTIIMG